MKTITINGRELPAIGLGTWHMGDQKAHRDTEIATLRTGIDAGVKVIDTAEMYGSGRSESLVGEAIAPYNREDLFIISKVLPTNANRHQMGASLDASLARLGTDYLDLYLYHWRGMTPLSETVSELERLKQTGKIRAWGVSNFGYADMQELMQITAGKNVAANEDLYNLGSRGTEVRLQPWQVEQKIPFVAYSPVGAGDSLGAQLTTNPAVINVAKRHEISVYQVILAWTIRNANVLAIPQTSNPKHMAANVAALNVNFSQKDLDELDQAFPKPAKEPPLDIL